MFRLPLRRLVIALALLAAAGSTLPVAPPAAAASIAATDPMTAVQWEAVKVPPKPELGVKPQLKIQNGNVFRAGRQTTYSFKVEGDGGTSENVKVKMRTYYRSLTDESDVTASGITSEAVAYPLTAPNYSNHSVTCNPPAGYYCQAGFIEATSSNGAFVQSWLVQNGNKT